MKRIVLALGVTQIIGYGSLYYAFAVLAPEITKSFGWSPEWTYAGFAIGLLAGGFAAPVAGRMVDRHGARVVMASGSILAALALVALSQATSFVGYIAALILLEVISTFVLYDAAFAALTQAQGTQARRSISKLTLIAGFASTIFWPLTTGLLAHANWRDIYLAYAAVHVLVCLPLHAFALNPRAAPRSAQPSRAADVQQPESFLTGALRDRAFILLALAFSLQGFVVSAMSIHMISLFHTIGLSAALAVTMGAIVGPSQVAGRLIEMLFGQELHPVTTAWTSAALMPIGFALLAAGGAGVTVAAAFAISYGVSMGMSSIVRGTVPLALFGPADYGAMLGKISAPGLIIKAAAPLAFAIMIERIGATASLWFATVLAALATLALIGLRGFARPLSQKASTQLTESKT